MKCKNCDNLTTQNFCANCGQNTKVDSIDLPNFLTELSDSVFQLNRGLFYTVLALFIRPGHTIREFLEGARRRHYRPIAFVLILSTVYFLISKIVGSNTFIDDALLGSSEAGAEFGVAGEKSPILNWISNNFAYVALLLIPIFSFTTYLSFSRFGQNFLEHIVINSFITGQQAIFYSFFMLLNVFINNSDLTTWGAILTAIPYAFWTFSQFYRDNNTIEVIFRLMLAYIIYIITVFIFLFALT